MICAKADLESKMKEISTEDIAAQRQKLHENMTKQQMDVKATYPTDNERCCKTSGAIPKKQKLTRLFSWSKDVKHLDVYENESLIIKVYKTDILKVPTEGLVNAANEDLLHIGGIARAIAKHAGKRLQSESRDIVKSEGEKMLLIL